VMDGSNTVVGSLVYRQTERVAFQDQFRTWAAIWDMTPTGVTMLRETTWDLDVDSSRTADQKAVPATTTSAASTSPVIAAPYANQKADEPANTMVNQFGTATRLFVKP
jgi:hypothetical protein